MKEKKVGKKKDRKREKGGRREEGKMRGREEEEERKREGRRRLRKAIYFSKGIRTNVNVLLTFFLTRLYPKAFI